MISFIRMAIKVLMNLPLLLLILLNDYIKYIKNQGWKIFEKWGLHIYVGKFGQGKTSSMVHDAYILCKQYPQVTIITNVNVTNFPKHTKILPLKTAQDILNAPDNCIVMIDEIGTIFNSRDFASSKESVPKILFQYLCQCRHRHLVIFGTAQRWGFVDKQIRDITATVKVSKINLRHPFSRLQRVYTYDAYEYDKAYTNPLLPVTEVGQACYIQTDKIRSLYDTKEMVNTLLKMEYVSDKEILENQGYTDMNVTDLEKKVINNYRRKSGKF